MPIFQFFLPSTLLSLVLFFLIYLLLKHFNITIFHHPQLSYRIAIIITSIIILALLCFFITSKSLAMFINVNAQEIDFMMFFYYMIQWSISFLLGIGFFVALK